MNTILPISWGSAPIVFGIAVSILMCASFWKIFTKAGVAGWKGLVPIYSLVQLWRIVGKSGWMAATAIIPVIGFAFIIVLYHQLSIKFGKGIGTTLGLLFAPFLFFPLLAFGKATFKKVTPPPFPEALKTKIAA